MLTLSILAFIGLYVTIVKKSHKNRSSIYHTSLKLVHCTNLYNINAFVSNYNLSICNIFHSGSALLKFSKKYTKNWFGYFAISVELQHI